jgi:hypothetical protein
MRRILCTSLILWMLISGRSLAQVSRPLQEFKDYLQVGLPVGFDSTLTYISYLRGGNLHYLQPLYQLLGQERKFRRILKNGAYNEEMSLALSFLGDYESAMFYKQPASDQGPDEVARRQVGKLMDGMKDIQHLEARRYISFVAREYRVIMINEAHDQPMHRAFTLSLLEDLYKRGYRYLAMEMLNNFSGNSLDTLNARTGHFCAEPVAGELIRRALELGYSLVSYEDTLAQEHSATQRDSIQAAHIYAVLLRDSSAKILVHAGYGHIAERNLDSGYIPMGMAFKKMSGIDPLTIDQTDMSECSDFAYGRFFYDAYLQKFPILTPSIALAGDNPINPTHNDIYDLAVIHPRTLYRDGRPTWLTLGGRRQPFYVKPPSPQTFLVQAYYQFESFHLRPGQAIPADQTYVATATGSYLLYLRRGNYILIFRDKSYRVLKTQHVEVN